MPGGDRREDGFICRSVIQYFDGGPSGTVGITEECIITRPDSISVLEIERFKEARFKRNNPKPQFK